MSDSPIEYILSRATQDLRALLNAAFEAGRAQGREDMKRNLLAVLSDTEQPSDIAPKGDLPDLDIAAEKVLARAPSGTVKPAIKALIETARDGIKASDIIEMTGFKDNSVRGTLAALRAEGFAQRRGEFWFLSGKEGSPSGESGPS